MKRDLITERIIDSELIEPGSVVVVGFSGGPDSLCLLHALSGISDAYDLTLIPVHVNHNLRPEAADEADHAELLCERMDLDCQVYDADCEELAGELGISTEEAGRQIRYEIFDDVALDAEESGVPREKIVIALAHNADDQAETVLFRLLRGTGAHGLAGIPAFRLSERGYAVVRPLLNSERSEIKAYIKENKLRPNIDRSNSENTYTRNRIRNELIPYLEENYNPRVKENLRRYAALAYVDDRLLTEIAFREYSDSITIDDKNDRAILDAKALQSNPPAVNSRVVGIVMKLLGLESCTTYENVTAITGLIYKDHPSAGIDLPYGIRAHREYDSLIFSANDETIGPDESISLHVSVVLAREFEEDEDSVYAAFDFDSFNAEYPGMIGEIRLRTRSEGDFLPMKQGNKKIQDFLVDSKVARSARDSILMVCIGSEVMWILPDPHLSGERDRTKGRFSPKFHITDATERVLLIELDETM